MYHPFQKSLPTSKLDWMNGGAIYLIGNTMTGNRFGGGLGNKEFSFEHGRCELLIRHPGVMTCIRHTL